MKNLLIYLSILTVLIGCKAQEPKVLTKQRLMRMDKNTVTKFIFDRVYVMGYDRMFSDFNIGRKKVDKKFISYNLTLKRKELFDVVFQNKFEEYFFQPQIVDDFYEGYQKGDTVYHTPHSYLRKQITDTLNYYIAEDSIREQMIIQSKNYLHMVDTAFYNLYDKTVEKELYKDRRGRYWKFDYEQ